MIKGFSSLLACFAFISCHVLTFLRYIGVYFMFGLLGCVRYNEDFVISRFCSIHFTVTLAELKNIIPYTEDLYRGSLNRGSAVVTHISLHKQCGVQWQGLVEYS